MATKVLSAAVIGLDAELVEVEADLLNQLPSMAIVGLPDKAVEESKERVKSAIKNSGIDFPRKKVTINLAPADVKKEGPSYDLPIAVSVLLSMNMLNLPQEWDKILFVGELALDGSLRTVSGVIAIALMAKAKGIQSLYLPKINADEAGLIDGIDIYGVESLHQLISHFKGMSQILSHERADIVSIFATDDESEFDIGYVKGQESVKRCLEIAAAGGHNILMFGTISSV